MARPGRSWPLPALLLAYPASHHRCVAHCPWQMPVSQLHLFYYFIFLEVVLFWDFLFAGKHSTCFMLSTKIVLVLSED